MTSRIYRETDAWKKANPWVLVNAQNSQSLCGRFATLEQAKAAAEERGGCIGVEGYQVMFSEMPLW